MTKFKELYPSFDTYYQNVVLKINSYFIETPVWNDPEKMHISHNIIFESLMGKYKNGVLIYDDVNQWEQRFRTVLIDILPILFAKSLSASNEVLSKLNGTEILKNVTRAYIENINDTKGNITKVQSSNDNTENIDLENFIAETTDITTNKDHNINAVEVENYINKVKELTTINASNFLNELLSVVELSTLFKGEVRGLATIDELLAYFANGVATREYYPNKGGGEVLSKNLINEDDLNNDKRLLDNVTETKKEIDFNDGGKVVFDSSGSYPVVKTQNQDGSIDYKLITKEELDIVIDNLENAIINKFTFKLTNYKFEENTELTLPQEVSDFFTLWDIANKYEKYPQVYIGGEKIAYEEDYIWKDNSTLVFKYANIFAKDYSFEIDVLLPVTIVDIEEVFDLVTNEDLTNLENEINNKIDSLPLTTVASVEIPITEVISWVGFGNRWQTRILPYLPKLLNADISNIVSMSTQIRSSNFEKEYSLAGTPFGSSSAFSFYNKRTIGGDVNDSTLYLQLKKDGSVNYNGKTDDTSAKLRVSYNQIIGEDNE